MVRFVLPVLAILALGLLLQCQSSTATLPPELGEGPIVFNQHIRPILSDRCWACHGPDAGSREANLRLDTEEGAFAALDSAGKRFAIIPGKANRSELFRRIVSNDPEELMPPPESHLSLSKTEIELLRRWIDGGAPWQAHWAFLSPVAPTVPEQADSLWSQTEIDRFLFRQMEQQGLSPAPPADKATQLRRLSFDLTGLPPTPSEIQRFLADDSPEAYEQAVDRLLASAHFGEQQAVHWLDLARYSDTHGYQADAYRPHWPWRDWVVEAFNENMPYDQFVSWQLAGDLYPDATQEQILATGFNRNHPQNAEGGIVQEEFRVEYVADRTQTLGTAFMGLTVGCARCHDHKYDPLSQQEFYQLFAFFNQVDEAGQITWNFSDMPGPTLLLTDSVQERERTQLLAAVQDQEAQLQAYTDSQLKEVESWLNRHQATRLGTQPPGLVAHFPLERVRISHLDNAVNFSRPGKIIDPASSAPAQNKPQVVPGKVGKALQLNGDDALTFPEVGRFSRAEPFTIGMWVQVPAKVEEGVIFHANKGSALYTFKGYQVSVKEDHFEVILAHDFPHQSLHLRSIQAVPRNEWTHLALAYDGSSRSAGVQLFLDGKAIEMNILRDHLVKDMVFHGKEPGQEGIATMLKIGGRWRGKGFTDGFVDEIKVFDRALSEAEIGWMMEEIAPSFPTETAPETILPTLMALYDEQYQVLWDSLTQARMAEVLQTEFIAEIMVMDDRKNPRPTYILNRGVYDAPGEEVQPASPESILPWPEELPRNRLGLATWLFHEDHPLTARVAVNQFWLRFFGRGLVATPEDFGSQGELPSHPALLDHLATSFQQSGWDVKALIKQIVMSQAYRQSAHSSPQLLETDPDNIWVARGPKKRLSGEMLRDQALSVSGLLVPKLGGEPVKPYQPAGLWDFNRMSGGYEQGTGEDLYRRSIYTFWKRTIPPPSMNTLDAPTRAYCVVQRQETQTPLQALVSLNDPQFVEAARKLAERMLTQEGLSEQIRWGYLSCTSQLPNQAEVTIFQRQFERSLKKYQQDQAAANALLLVGESEASSEFPAPTLAAMTQVAMNVLNVEAAMYR